ncbi:helix-turn-helix domain-containing protein [Streptomyces sp. NPDC002580]|uniref:helix-turn-helix domain-containing protein n=1 Tax=Streptomyces sp. NPDC002580 TaxID=3364653 RepID=UPI0036CE19DB
MTPTSDSPRGTAFAAPHATVHGPRGALAHGDSPGPARRSTAASASTGAQGLVEEPLTVPDALRPWFAGVGFASVDEDRGGPFTHVPDAATKLVFRVDGSDGPEVLVVGPRTRASYHAAKRPASCVELRLGPGATRPLLGVPAVDLVGRIARLGDFPSATARLLAKEVVRPERGQVVPRLADALRKWPPPDDPARSGLLRAAVAAMSTDPDTGRFPSGVRELAHRLAVSERQLRNLFADGVGVSPKHYARIARVRRVLTHAHRSPDTPWAQLAASTGYYDQSHMTADFRALMGVPPTAFFTGRLPPARPCQAYASARVPG